MPIRALVVLFVFFLTGPCLAEEPPIHIKFSSQFPPDSETIQSAFHFKRRVEAESRGKIFIDMYDSSKLYDSNHVAAALTEGKVDMAHVVLARYAPTVPIADAHGLPFLFSDAIVERMSRKLGAEIRKIIEQAILEEGNARVLWWVPEGPNVILSRGAPVSTPAELAGKRVRSNGPLTAKSIEACGGIPVDVPSDKQYEVYASGAVDAAMATISSVGTRKLYEVMGIITRINQAAMPDVVVVNEDFWRTLSDGQQEILLSAAAEADLEEEQHGIQLESSIYDRFEKLGAKVVTISTSDLLSWRYCTGDILSDYISRAGPKGDRLMKAYAKLLQDPCCNHANRERIGLGQ